MMMMIMMMLPNSKLLNFSAFTNCSGLLRFRNNSDKESLRHLMGLLIYDVRPLRISIHQAVRHHTVNRLRGHCYQLYAVKINVYGKFLGVSNKRSVHSVCTHFSVRLLPCGEPIRAGTSISNCINSKTVERIFVEFDIMKAH